MIDIYKDKPNEKTAEKGKIFLLLFIIAVITLYPLIFVGITTHDDAEISLNFGWSTGLFETAAWKAELQGRIAFFWFYPLLRLPYAFDSPIFYLVTKYGSLLVLLAAFYYMIFKVIRSDRIALLSLLLFFVFVQNGWDHNALTSYPFAFNLIAALFLFSMGLLATAIDEKRISLAIIASLLYFFALASELFVLFFPFYLVLLTRGRKPEETYSKLIISRWLYISPAIFSLVTYLILYIIWRALHPSNYDGNSLNTVNFLGVVKVVGAYSLSAFPFQSLQFFFSPAHQSIYSDSVGLSGILTNLSAAIYIKPILVSSIFYLLLTVIRYDVTRIKLLHTSIVLAFIGIFLPNLLLGLVQKHQIWVASASYSYLYTFYSFLSAIILMALLLALLHLISRAWKSWIRKTVFLMLTLSLAFVTFAVDVRNHYITNDQKLSHRKWQLMEAMVNSPAFAEVLDGSVIVAPTLTSHQRGIAAAPSLYWSKYVKKKTGKSVNFFDDGCKEHIACYALVFRQSSHSDDQFIAFGKVLADNHRVSSDVFIYTFQNQSSGYLIGRYDASTSLPSLSINNAILTNMAHGSFATQLRSAPVAGQAQVARLTGNVDIFMDEVTITKYNFGLRFQPLLVELGSGFYGWETSFNEPSWSWGREAAELIINNNIKNAVAARVSFEATSLENLNLRIMGLQEEVFSVMPGKYLPISVNINLLPGVNYLKIRTDRPPIKPSINDQRMLSFSIRNPSVYQAPLTDSIK
jgi:hypothetical protein